MGLTITQYQETPNPNALKCLLSGSAGAGIRSFRGPVEAANDPIGTALFGVKGVTSLLINDRWIAVNKSPSADWASVKRGVERALAGLSLPAEPNAPVNAARPPGGERAGR